MYNVTMPYKDPERQKKAQKESYERNRASIAQNRKKRQKAKYKRIQDIKEASPCVDCKINYPYYVMQFDHIGTDKVANVGQLSRSAGWAAVEAEIAKCEIVCANCHAIRTWKRRQSTLDTLI